MTWILQSATILTIDLDLATLCEDLTIWQTGDNGKRNLVLARIWQGSILPRPLTYNLFKVTENPLPKGTLCGKYDPEWAKGRESIQTRIIHRSVMINTFYLFFKNNGYSKTLCEWSTDLIGPKQEKKYVQDKDVQKDLLWPLPHNRISVLKPRLLTCYLLPKEVPQNSEYSILNYVRF